MAATYTGESKRVVTQFGEEVNIRYVIRSLDMLFLKIVFVFKCQFVLFTLCIYSCLFILDMGRVNTHFQTPSSHILVNG